MPRPAATSCEQPYQLANCCYQATTRFEGQSATLSEMGFFDS